VIRLQFNDSRNLQSSCAVLLISFTEVIGCVPSSRGCQILKLHRLLQKPLHAMQNCCSYCAHHQAGFVIFSPRTLLCLLIILIFPILPMFGTCNNTQTVSNNYPNLVKCFFGLSGRLSRVFSHLCNFLLSSNCCLCGFNSLSCHRGLTLIIILDSFLFLITASKLRFLSFLCHKLVFGSQAAQLPKDSKSFCLQGTLVLVGLMMSSCGTLRRFAIFASRKWRKVLFQSIDNCSWC
jgi:hypothetical protein